MPDDVIRIGTRVDVSPLEQLAQKLKEDGLSADDASSALRNLGVSAKDAQAMVEGLYGVNQEVAESLNRVTRSAEGTTASFYKVSLAGQELGVRIPRAMERVIANSELMSSAINAAFPILAGIGFAEVLIHVGEKAYEVAKQFIDWNTDLSDIPGKMSAIDERVKSIYEKTHQLVIEQQIYEGHLTKAQADALKAGDTINSEVEARFALNRLLEQQSNLHAEIKKRQDAEAAAAASIARNQAQAMGQQGSSGAVAATRTLTDDEIAQTVALEQEIRIARARVDELHQSVQTGSAKASKEAADEWTKGAKKAEEAEEKASQHAYKMYNEMVKAHQEANKKHEELEREMAAAEQRMQAEITKYYQEEGKKRQQLSIEQVEAEHQANQQRLKTQEVSVKGMGTTGQISKGSELQALRVLHDQELAEDVRYIQEKIRILSLDPENNAVAIQKAQAELTAIRAKGHQQEIADTAAIIKQQQQHYQQFFTTIGHGLDTAITGYIQGTQRIGQAFNKMFASIVVGETQALAKMATQWLAHEAAITLAHQAGNQARVASDAAAAAQSQGIQMTDTLKTVSQEAVKAAAKVYSAVAGIPLVGPVLAPIAAGAAFAGVMAFGAMASFDQGTMAVPRTGVAMLHAGEAVLPPPQTQVLQQLLAGGATGSATKSLTVQNNTNIHPMGDESFKGMLDRHNDYVVNNLVRALRRKNMLPA